MLLKPEVFKIKDLEHELKCNDPCIRMVNGAVQYPIENRMSYFDFNKENKITYWDTSRGPQPLNDNGKWKKEGRAEMKPGKFLLMLKEFYQIIVYDESGERHYLRDDDFDKAFQRYIEIFTDRIKADNQPITPLVSKKVEETYQIRTSDHAKDTLKSSCMRPEADYSCKHYSGFYDLIPGVEVVFGLSADGNLLYRALLWSVEYEDEKIKFLDRVYGSSSIAHKLTSWAEEKGYAYRGVNDCSIYYKDKYIELSVVIPDEAFSYLEKTGSPYVDTLSNLCTCNIPTLSNHQCSDYELTCCSGETITGRIICYSCDNRVNGDDAFHNNGHTYCEECFGENFRYCEDCGEYCDPDYVHYVNDTDMCEDCLRRKGYYNCDNCGEWSDDCREVGDRAFCIDCLERNYYFCEGCEEWVKDVDSVTVDGEEKSLCEDCVGNLPKCPICEKYSDNIRKVASVYMDGEKSDIEMCPICEDKLHFCEGMDAYIFESCESCNQIKIEL